MRAVVLERVGGAVRLHRTDVPDPAPGPGEVLIRVERVGVNHMELLQLAGVAPPGALDRVIPGIDPSGTVVAAGPGTEATFALGDPVVVKPASACGSCRACRHGDDDACREARITGVHRDGGWAELVSVPIANVFRLPAGVDAGIASAFSHSFPVAWQVLLRCGSLRPDDTVLVIGGAGGVGSAAVQLAVHHGCRVLATASTAAKEAVVRDLGAVPIPSGVDASTVVETVRMHATDGVDVIVDTAADPALWAVLPTVCAPLARIGVCGTHAGGGIELDLRWLYRGRIRLAGSAGASVAAYHDCLELLAGGAIRSVIDSVHALDDFEDALTAVRDRGRAGKVLLAP
jgi:NADPH:quinone reductase-like Zn-dependent oxidoreductase